MKLTFLMTFQNSKSLTMLEINFDKGMTLVQIFRKLFFDILLYNGFNW